MKYDASRPAFYKHRTNLSDTKQVRMEYRKVLSALADRNRYIGGLT